MEFKQEALTAQESNLVEFKQVEFKETPEQTELTRVLRQYLIDDITNMIIEQIFDVVSDPSEWRSETCMLMFGVKHGIVCIYSHGKLCQRLEYSHGVIEGTVTRYYRGKIATVDTHHDGWQTGKFEKYDNGIILKSGTRLRNRLHGVVTLWKNNAIFTAISYHRDRRHGECKYYTQGILEKIITYTYGLRINCRYYDAVGRLHGRFTTWLTNGNRSETCNYVHGELDGTRVRWHNNKLLERCDYVRGERHGSHIQLRDGNLHIHHRYVRGVRHGESYVVIDGVKVITNYVDGVA